MSKGQSRRRAAMGKRVGAFDQVTQMGASAERDGWLEQSASASLAIGGGRGALRAHARDAANVHDRHTQWDQPEPEAGESYADIDARHAAALGEEAIGEVDGLEELAAYAEWAAGAATSPEMTV